MHDASGNPRYETRDVTARSMVWSAIGLIALTVVGLAASAIVMKYFVTVQKLGPPASPFDQTRTLPPAPRLSVSPVEELRKYEAEERSKLDQYEWIDPSAGTVRIPIERAMELSLEKGFPVRTNPGAHGPAPRPRPNPAAPVKSGP